MGRIETARAFIEAVRDKNANAAAELCADDVEITLPLVEQPLRGKEGVRQMIQMAPELTQSLRAEEERDGAVRITTLTRAPGVFANYTTWKFVLDGELVKRLSFEFKGAN